MIPLIFTSCLLLAPPLMTADDKTMLRIAEAFVDQMNRSEARADMPVRLRLIIANNMLMASNKISLKETQTREMVEYLFEYLLEIDEILEDTLRMTLNLDEVMDIAVMQLRVRAKKDQVIARLVEFARGRSEVRGAA